MIPMVAELQVRDRQNREFHLWIPLILLWIVLLPVTILIVPFIFLACLFQRMNPFQVLPAFWEVLSALKGTHMEFNHPKSSALIHIF